jgi:general L-amino acid transport system substrate-binding protein
MTLRSLLAAALLLLASPGLAAAQGTPPPQPPAAAARGGSPVFDAVRARDHIRCGVSQGTPGFSTPDSQGRWTGFDVEFCRALAAAVLGDAGKVRFQPYSAQQRFTALQSGEIDVLSRNTTWTFQRDIQLGLEYASPTTTAPASSPASSPGWRTPANSTAPRFACRPAPPTS